MFQLSDDVKLILGVMCLSAGTSMLVVFGWEFLL
jgi:hypothetical protein